MPLVPNRSLFADPDRGDSLSARARARRWDTFMGHFPDLGDMTVLDLGGTPQFWRNTATRPAHVTCVNTHVDADAPEDWMTIRAGDACAAPTERYDLVFSNSVIEHVGGHDRRKAFADAVHAAADRHWIQTPYRYFPVEPHWVFPGFQFLPTAAAMQVSRRWPYGRRSTSESAFEDVASVELLGINDMRGYFPDSDLWYERFLGLTKSVVAVRSRSTGRA